MTAYNPIISSETDPDAPLTSFLGKRWSDNWLAGFEGQPAAPKLRMRALEPTVAGPSMKFDRASNPIVIAGQNVQQFFEVGTLQLGTVRFYTEVSSFGGGNQLIHQVIRNGGVITLSSVTIGATGNTGRSFDIAVLPGDLLRVLIQGGPGSSDSIRLNRFGVGTNGQDLFPSNSASYGYNFNAYILP